MSHVFSLPHERTLQRILMRFLFVINVRNNEPPEQLGYRQKHHTTKPTSYTLWPIWYRAHEKWWLATLPCTLSYHGEVQLCVRSTLPVCFCSCHYPCLHHFFHHVISSISHPNHSFILVTVACNSSASHSSVFTTHSPWPISLFTFSYLFCTRICLIM